MTGPRVRRRRRRPLALVYHPDGSEAYARLITVPRGADVTIQVCATEEEAAAHIGDAEVLYCWKLPPALYGKAGRLRWLQAMGAGVEWALVPDLRRRVLVTRAPGVFGPWMSEYVIGWCAWVTQRMETYRAAQRERRWRDDVLPERLRGRTLTLVGIGDIGGEIARVARAVGLHVVGVSRSGRRVPHVDRVHRVWNLHRALSAADFVVVVAPLTPATRGLIDARALAAMRPAAWLLNVGRGPVVDEAALIEALRTRRIAGAILDVFDTEPLPAEHPLWRLDNVVITPHIAGPSTPEEIAPIFNANLARWLTGQPLLHLVDRRQGY
ncbi:MAG: D-2-hydroxyacid dehydrogenase [Candidatus Rokuibacteriota bacterium]|nr:MAG: D-2-hydroxyacid dehydrogenase [Candidatus Rokubacteria bacterium]